MEKPYSQANQPNSACPSTFNGGVTVLPCPFHHNPLSSAAFKVSRTPPAPNTSLCHHLSLTINQINRFINACSSNKGSKNGRKPSAEFTSWEKSWNNLREFSGHVWVVNFTIHTVLMFTGIWHSLSTGNVLNEIRYCFDELILRLYWGKP